MHADTIRGKNIYLSGISYHSSNQITIFYSCFIVGYSTQMAEGKQREKREGNSWGVGLCRAVRCDGAVRINLL